MQGGEERGVSANRTVETQRRCRCRCRCRRCCPCIAGHRESRIHACSQRHTYLLTRACMHACRQEAGKLTTDLPTYADGTLQCTHEVALLGGMPAAAAAAVALFRLTAFLFPSFSPPRKHTYARADDSFSALSALLPARLASTHHYPIRYAVFFIFLLFTSRLSFLFFFEARSRIVGFERYRRNARAFRLSVT